MILKQSLFSSWKKNEKAEMKQALHLGTLCNACFFVVVNDYYLTTM